MNQNSADYKQVNVSADVDRNFLFTMTAVNVLYERYRFHQRCQQSEETLQTFVNDVLELAQNCDFGDYLPIVVRDKVLFDLNDEEAKWRIIHQGGNPTLDDVMGTYNEYDMTIKCEIDIKPFELSECKFFHSKGSFIPLH